MIATKHCAGTGSLVVQLLNPVLDQLQKKIEHICLDNSMVGKLSYQLAIAMHFDIPGCRESKYDHSARVVINATIAFPRIRAFDNLTQHTFRGTTFHFVSDVAFTLRSYACLLKTTDFDEAGGRHDMRIPSSGWRARRRRRETPYRYLSSVGDARRHDKQRAARCHKIATGAAFCCGKTQEAR
jgi:hypothetical protein